MPKDGEDKLLHVFKNLGYQDPYQKLNELLEELYRQGEFLYITVPRNLDTDGDEGDEEVVLAEFRLSRN